MKYAHHDNQALYNLMCSGWNSTEFPGYQSAMIVSNRKNKIHQEFGKENLAERKSKGTWKINLFAPRKIAKDLLAHR